MRRTIYPIATGVLTVLVLIAFIAALLRPFVPNPQSPRLAGRVDEFVLAGRGQPVLWRPLEPGAFALARRGGLPILLFVGVTASSLAAELDQNVFTDPDVARYVNMNFHCLRVDGLQHPQWVNAFSPISRLREEFVPGAQIWVLDPGGDVIGFIGRTAADEVFTADVMLRRLIDIRKIYDRYASGEMTPRLDLVQRSDLARLSSLEKVEEPNLDLYERALQSVADAERGGFPRRGMQELRPLAYVFLARRGRIDQLREALDPMLVSPMGDVVDGSFFRLARSADFRQVSFSKSSAENADMLLALAIALRHTDDPLYAWWVDRLFDYLLRGAVDGERLAAFQVEKGATLARSPRNSFSAAKLREALTPAQRSWARQNLGLDVMGNPQMTPYLVSGAVVLDPTLPEVLASLRQSISEPRNLSGTGYFEVEAYVAARLVEAARIVGDAQRLNSALSRVAGLEAFRTGTTFARRLPRSEYAPPYLGDALSYADAKLQEYLATGEHTALSLGLSALVEAERSFRGDRLGEYVLAPPPSPWPYTNVPELVDNLRESCTARMLRLAWMYGELLSDSDEGRSLSRVASDVARHFASVAQDGGVEVAGFYHAAAMRAQVRKVLSVGPDAVQDAAWMASQVPSVFVAPAVGPIRRDLQERGPGLYVTTSDHLLGPLSREEAVEALQLSALDAP
jgi:uncharacterized protein YyaL (SSP411 family)